MNLQFYVCVQSYSKTLPNPATDIRKINKGLSMICYILFNFILFLKTLVILFQLATFPKPYYSTIPTHSLRPHDNTLSVRHLLTNPSVSPQFRHLSTRTTRPHHHNSSRARTPTAHTKLQICTAFSPPAAGVIAGRSTSAAVSGLGLQYHHIKAACLGPARVFPVTILPSSFHQAADTYNIN